ncbi:hypothetical protein BJY04DRAFT_215636 [Aspergillus karnatakaensis]|uniref:uncharacterized protein n=1 Tax=Aspergillus karnatakaensis TaxID=1810916 RepID=UPI003CCCFEC9
MTLIPIYEAFQESPVWETIMGKYKSPLIALLSHILPSILAQDEIGFSNGVSTFRTEHWNAIFVNDSGTLASLRPSGSDFDFLPYDLMQLGRRVQHGCYHWGDITLRYRNSSQKEWVDVDSATVRKPATTLDTGALLATNLSDTVPTGPLSLI